MQLSLIIGNIFSLCAVICLAISVIKNSKKDLVFWQILEVIFGIVVNIVLSAYTALIIGIIALTRNILSYKNILTKKATLILLIINIIIGLYVNNLGIIGLLAIIASSSYTICLCITKNEQQMRYALVFNLILWFIHDLYIQAYPSSIFNIFLCIWTIIQILKNKHN